MWIFGGCDVYIVCKSPLYTITVHFLVHLIHIYMYILVYLASDPRFAPKKGVGFATACMLNCVNIKHDALGRALFACWHGLVVNVYIYIYG